MTALVPNANLPALCRFDLIARRAMITILAGMLTWGQVPEARALEVDTTATLMAPTPVKPDPMDSVPAQPDPVTTGIAYQTVDFEKPMLLATWKGGAFTSHDLSATLALRQPPSAEGLEPAGYPTVPASRWRNVVRDLIYEQAIYDKAVAEGITSATPTIAQSIEEARKAALNRIFFNEEVARRLPIAEERLAREFYNANLTTQFTVPERTILTSLQFPLYDEVTVQPGETLVSIAERISGSAEDRWRILRGTEPFAPRLPQGRARNSVPYVEVRPGEKLLVPVSREEKARRLAAANAAQIRLANGESVTSVVASLPPNAPPVRLGVEGRMYTPDFERMTPPVNEAIRALTTATQSQAVTNALEGPFGYDLFVLMARITTSTVEFDQAKDTILESLRDNEATMLRLREEIRAEIFDELRTTHSLQLNTNALERADYGGEDPLTGSTWIIRTKDFTYTLDDFLRDLASGNRTWTALSPVQRIEIAKAAPAVIRHLVTIESARTNLEQHPEYMAEVRSREIQEVTKEWLRRESVKDGETTEGTLREYYKQHIDRYTSTSMVTIREITRRFDPALIGDEKTASIERARSALLAVRDEAARSKEDFERVARRHSASISTRSRGGLVGTVPINFRGPVVEAELRKLRVGEVTPPIVVGAEVILYRMDDVVGGVVQPFEAVGGLVLRDWLEEIPRKRQVDRRNAVLREAEYKLHF